PSQRDPELLARLRWALRTRHAADREHHDFHRPYAETARHRRMSQLMQQHRSEKRQNVNRGAGAGLLFANSDEEQEDEKEQKREVEPDGNSEDAENADGSTGERLISHPYFNSTA